MAKIDVSKIDGYAEMSAEDKIKALEEFSLPDPDYTGYVKKELFDKKASELAEANKKLKDGLSEDEKERQEREQKMTDLENEIASLKKEKTIAGYKAKYLAQGMDDELATKTAEALEKGDSETVFANQRKFLESFEKKIRTEALGDVDKPPKGNSGSGETDDVKFAKDLAKKQAEGIQSFAEGMKHYL